MSFTSKNGEAEEIFTDGRRARQVESDEGHRQLQACAGHRALADICLLVKSEGDVNHFSPGSKRLSVGVGT